MDSQKLELRLNFTSADKFYDLFKVGEYRKPNHNSEELKRLQQDLKIPDNFATIYSISENGENVNLSICARLPSGIGSYHTNSPKYDTINNNTIELISELIGTNYVDLPKKNEFPFIQEPINNIYCLFNGENPDQFFNNLVDELGYNIDPKNGHQFEKTENGIWKVADISHII